MKLTFMALIVASTFMACNTNTSNENKSDTTPATVSVKKEAITYTADTLSAQGFIVYDENKQGKRPGVLIVHEWWGAGDYVRSRARQLAEMGYVAMVVDMYGNGRLADNPTDAQTLATPYYIDPKLAKIRLDAALTQLKTYAQTDTANIAAIGYCFGGYVVINAAKLGADLKGVVSFHGGLAGVPANKDLLKANVLVLHGEADNFVPKPEVDAFRKGMDSINADYSFIAYPNATHAFTNPDATEVGKKFNMPIKYDAAADSASWKDMKAFFDKIFN